MKVYRPSRLIGGIFNFAAAMFCISAGVRVCSLHYTSYVIILAVAALFNLIFAFGNIGISLMPRPVEKKHCSCSSTYCSERSQEWF